MITILRKLTLRSKLGFGKYADLTVGDLFAMSMNSYLAWAYYNVPKISFVDEILDQLCIEHRIDKPGTDTSWWHENGKLLNFSYLPEESEHINLKKKIKRLEKNHICKLSEAKASHISRRGFLKKVNDRL